MLKKYFVFCFFCSCCVCAPDLSFAEMGRFGGWTELKRRNAPSGEQVKNATFGEVDYEVQDADSKPRAGLSGKVSVNTGVIYTVEDRYELPPVKFDTDVYSDAMPQEEKGFKTKAIRAIDGLNITESGTYIAD